MSRDNRPRFHIRPPERTGAIRGPATSRSRHADAPSARTPRFPRDFEPPPDGVPRSVYNAYRVLDDQFACGQDTARRYGPSRGRGGLSRGYGPDPVRGMSRLLTQMFLVWRDLLGPLVPQDMRSVRWDPEEDAYDTPSDAEDSAPRERARVTFDVTASKRVAVTLDLDLEDDLEGLAVLDLVAFDDAEKGAPGKDRRPPAIQDVGLERTDDGSVVVRLTVPPDQPPGTYLGMIVDRARAVPYGSVRVRVEPPQAAIGGPVTPGK